MVCKAKREEDIEINMCEERLTARVLQESEDKLFKYRIEFEIFKKPIGNCFVTQEIGAIFTEL